MALYSLHEPEKLPKTLPNYDVLIIGTGAGGGVAADRLSKKGLKVAVIEMGPGKKTKDFVLEESKAYENLYQEAAGRKTLDGTINILQGRTLGGGTTVNWTSSFRTPELTLQYWEEKLGIKFSTDMEDFFDEAERIINVKPWDIEPNRNNSLLEEGCKRLGYSFGSIKRNVKNCQNLGYCGFGCPVGAKQSSLVTTLKAAESRGADIFCDAFAFKFLHTGKKITSLVLTGRENKFRLKIDAKKIILAAGAIGSPALMMRSNLPDPYKLLGKRTFLHPVTISGGIYKEQVEPYYGAPQTIYSDHFIPKELEEKFPGFKLEVPPIHPVLIGTSLPFYGKTHREFMEKLPNLQAIIALQRDGFHPDSPGGEVQLSSNGMAVLDYKTTPYVEEGFRKAILKMGEIQFAAGAKEVMPLHKRATRCKTFGELKKQVESLSMSPFSLKVVSAHVMGGCPMAKEESQGVVGEDGRHFQVENLWVMDGSLFPTSIGTNPMISIMAQSLRMLRQF